MDRHFYMELFPVSHFMPNFQPRRAASGLGTAPLVPKCPFPLPAAVDFLLNLAPSSAGVASAHHTLLCSQEIFFPWSWNGMLQKCCHKLLRSYLERVGGLIRCYKAQPSHTTSHPWLMARILDTFSSYYQLQKSFQQNLKESVKEYRLLPVFSVCCSKMSEKFEH